MYFIVNWFGVVMLGAGTLAVVVVLATWWHERTMFNPDSQSVIFGLVGLFALGLGLQRLSLGPEFIRFHLSDLGFPVTGLWLYWHIQRLGDLIRRVRGIQPRLVTLALHVRLLRFERRAVIGYALFAVALEAFFPAIGLPKFGFDWVDVAAYALGAGIAYAFITRDLRLLARRPDAD